MHGSGLGDDVFVDGRHGRVACFGREGRDLQAGDRVVLHRAVDDGRAAMLADIMWDDSDAFAVLHDGEPVDDRDYQVVMDDGSYLTVVDGALAVWDDRRRPEVPLVDTWGRRWDEHAPASFRAPGLVA